MSANPAWEAHQGSLQRSGYFGGNIEGSAAHRRLLAAAQDSFRASEAYERSTAELAAPARRIDALLEVRIRAYGLCTPVPIARKAPFRTHRALLKVCIRALGFRRLDFKSPKGLGTWQFHALLENAVPSDAVAWRLVTLISRICMSLALKP